MPTRLETSSLPQPRDPVLALLLSFFPGGGQIYNGHLGKALLVILTYPWSLILGLGPYDAYRSARRHNEMLELLAVREPLQLEAPASQSPAVVYRRLVERSEAPAAQGTFYRAGLMAILGAAIAASAASGGLAAPVVLGVALAAVSTIVMLAAARDRHRQSLRELIDLRSELQSQVISLAARQHGRLTLAQVVDATKLGLTEAQELMESLALVGQVEYVVEEDGGMTYLFTDLVRLTHLGPDGQSVERAVLAYAQRARGRITLGELAIEIGLPLRTLRSCLAELAAEGFVREEDEGLRTVYVFPEFVR
jgi:hypothetical protein